LGITLEFKQVLGAHLSRWSGGTTSDCWQSIFSDFNYGTRLRDLGLSLGKSQAFPNELGNEVLYSAALNNGAQLNLSDQLIWQIQRCFHPASLPYSQLYVNIARF
jgi:hypothetical protein